MSKKIKTTNTDMTVYTEMAMIVKVGSFKFIKEDDYPWIDIFLMGDEKDEFIEQDDSEKVCEIVDLTELKVYALNWFHENVEIVKEITAQEVPVQEQYVGKCNYCEQANAITLPSEIAKPNYCMGCGKPIEYTNTVTQHS